MAATASDLVMSLIQDEIPFKLRCASCNSLVVHAFRLPCCDQNVCEHCQMSLPESCPVCMHKPLSADDCKPNKSLRLTVKAFLKAEEKKRNKESSTANAPATSSSTSGPEATPIIAEETGISASGHDTVEGLGQPTLQTKESNAELEMAGETEDAPSSPNSSVEITLEAPNYDGISRREKVFGRSFEHISTQDGGDQIPRAMEEISYHPTPPVLQDPQSRSGDEGINFVGTNNFGAMSNTSDMGSMATMQSAFSPAHWSGFSSMMGTPAMSLDFMSAYQGMFGGFNGQTMGFHGVNDLHMGLEGGYGGCSYQSTMGMNVGSSGNFGASAGYYPSSGYNQQSHQKHLNQMHHQQFPMNNYKRNRFQGQGYQRGCGRDRGSHLGHPQRAKSSFHVLHDNQMDLTRRSQENSALSARSQPGTNKTDSDARTYTQVDDLNFEKRDNINTNGCNGEQDFAESVSGANNTGRKVNIEDKQQDHPGSTNDHPVKLWCSKDDQSRQTFETNLRDTDESIVLHRIPTQVSTEGAANESNSMHDPAFEQLNALPGPVAPLPISNYRDVRTTAKASFEEFPIQKHGILDRSQCLAVDLSDASPEEPASQKPTSRGQGVEGAPTGPKAMRDGLPNSGHRGRGGFVAGGRNGRQGRALPVNGLPASAPNGRIGFDIHEAQSPKDLELSRAHHMRRYSQSTADLTDDVGEREHRKTSRSTHQQLGQCDPNPEARHDSIVYAQHSTSPHRRRRTSKNRRASPSQRDAGPRSGRGGSRSDSEPRPDVKGNQNSQKMQPFPRRNSANRHTYETAKEKARIGSRSERSASSTRRYRAERHRDDYGQDGRHMEDYATNSKANIDHTGTSQSPIQEFKIKDRSKRTASDLEKTITEGQGSMVDPHTMEREARNRERLAKEQQRRNTLAASASAGTGKRGREVVLEDANTKHSRRKLRNEPGSARRNRTMSYQYDDDEESRESRALRVETEREAARWA